MAMKLSVRLGQCAALRSRLGGSPGWRAVSPAGGSQLQRPDDMRMMAGGMNMKELPCRIGSLQHSKQGEGQHSILANIFSWCIQETMKSFRNM